MSSEDRIDTRYLGGERIVDPGHPITLAYLITRCYAPGRDFSHALADSIIPGSMDSLSFAVNGLLSIKDKRFDFEVFKEKSNKFWSKTCDRLGQNGGQGAVSGQIQADNLTKLLESMLKEWLR